MGHPIKYKKGDLVGKQNIEMISDSWVPEGKSNATRRSNFKCPYCENTFEASIDHVRKCKNGSIISCGCKLEVKRYKIGQIVGNGVEILDIYSNKGLGIVKNLKYKFKCKDCGRPFICGAKQVISRGRTSCGCTLRKQKLYKGDILNGFKVINPNHSQGIRGRYISTYECKHCKDSFDSINTLIRNGHKDSCGCTSVASKGEVALYEFIKEILPNEEVEQNPRILNLKEIDVFISSKRIGFEFNGLYWHSDALGKDEYYHIGKTEVAKEKNIELIHIFEHQWKFKEDLVKDYILKYLNLQSSEIDLSLCNIQEVSKEDSLTFHTDNNLYDSQTSDINLGLHFMNECVALMSINKFESHYEITTLSMKKGFYNKDVYKYLLNHFETNYPKKDIHYKSDIALPIKNILEYLGFSFYKREFPKGYYFNPSNLDILNGEQINDILQNSPIKEDEYQAITEEGYLRYWDCGKDTYIKQKGNL